MTIMVQPVTLIIAHAEYSFRLILQNILQSNKGFRVVGQAATAEELIAAAATLQPQVIIAGIALAGMADGSTLRQLALCCQKAKVIISWRYQYYNEVAAIAIAGTSCGYIVQDASVGQYSLAVKAVLKGEVYYCSQTKNFCKSQKNPLDMPSLKQLRSPGLLLVIKCKWLGFSSKETKIAAGVTEHTVVTYRKNLHHILGSRSSAALAEFMMRNGMM